MGTGTGKGPQQSRLQLDGLGVADPSSGNKIERFSRREIELGFLNVGHALDHFVILIYPTVIIALQVAYGRSYSDLIFLGTASFTAFGLFSLPAGWLGDRWSRRNMMAAFYLGSGFSLVAAAFAPTLLLLAAALFALGIFASIYHPVGTALVLEHARQRGRTMAFNAIAGNLGLALAAGVSAVLTVMFSWRAAFMLPGLVCIVAGAAYLYFIPRDTSRAAVRNSTPEVALSGTAALTIFALLMFVALCAGLVVNSVILSVPKIVDERVMGSIPLLAVGGLATAIFLCGALAQIIVGRLAEHIRPHILFVLIAILQFGGVVWAVYASGISEIVALAITMAAILGQVTTNDLVIARYTPDAWRSRAYAVRYCLTFLVSGVSAWMIAVLYSHGGFAFVLGTIALIALFFLIAVLGVACLAEGSENSLAKVARHAESGAH